MKYSLNSVSSHPSLQGSELDVILDMQCIQEDLYAITRDVPEMETVLENLTRSIDLLNKAEDTEQVLSVLNSDKSIERLLGVAENQLSVKMATEGLGEALKTAWNKIKEFFKKIIDWIKNFFGLSSKKVEQNAEKANALKDKVEKVLPEELKKMLDEPMPGLLTKKCVDAMYSKIGYLTGAKGPIGKFSNCFSAAIKRAEEFAKKIDKGEAKFGDDEDFDGLEAECWKSAVGGVTGRADDTETLEPFGMAYGYSLSKGFELIKVDEGFLEKCDTLKAGGWTDPEQYVDRCASICNCAYNAYKSYMKSQSQIDSDLKKCTALVEKLFNNTNTATLTGQAIATKLMRHSRELAIIVSRLKQINDACYCSALDSRVMKIVNRNLQSQYKIED